MLSWSNSTDNVGVTGYLVYLNGNQVGTSLSTSYLYLSGLVCGTNYTLGVAAIDAAGNVSTIATITQQTSACPDTTPPSAPGTLSATAISATRIDLSWGAATDNTAVTGYQIERCQGTGCTTFTQIATTTTATSYSDTTTVAGTSYSYRVRANDAVPNLGPYSNTATATTPTPDTTPPSAPGTLSATAISATRVDLSWGAATDNIAVTGYQIERCQGAGCTTFAQIATTTTATSYSDTTTVAGTSYSYRVRANDAVPNLGPYSNTATATTPTPDTTPPSAPGTLSATAISATRVDLSWGAATDNVAVTGYQIERCQGAGCTTFTQIATTTTATTYSDTTTVAGTSYSYRVRANDAVPNLGPYSNTATLTTPDTTPPSTPTGLATSGVGQTTIMLTWSNSTDNVGVTGYLVYLNGNQVGTSLSTSYLYLSGLVCGTNYTLGVAAIDAAGNVSTIATITQQTSACPDTTPPSAPGTLSATAISATRIDLSWGAATDNTAVTGYQIERCQGTGCTTFTQIATTTTATSYSDTTTVAGTSYSYRVRANDAVPNLGPYSNTATATTPTPDTTPPSAPGTLSATAISATRVDLSWGAATDNTAVTGYQIERCQGAGCTTFTQIATTTTATSYSDTTTVAGTSYSYRVRANDAVPNLGPYSNTATLTTPGPTAPTPVAAYAFEEGTGTTVTDQSGNGNNGTLTNTTWVAAGKYGRALSFNGTSSRLTVPNSTSLQLSTGMTLETWVNPTTVSSAWRDIIEKGNDNYYLMATTDRTSFPAGGGTFGGANANAYATGILPTNSWTHLATTYDGTNLRLYVNGTLVATQAKTGAITTSTSALTIGSDPFYGQFFNGQIDELRIYKTALTQTQIQTDMATPVGGGSAPPPPPTYSIGGTVSGLSGTVVLQNNGGNDLTVTGNGPFTFSTLLATGATYSVTVRTNPFGQACTASNASGTVASANVTNVAVTCATSSATAGSDDFNRADGALGANWADLADGGLSISSQAVVGSSGGIAGDLRTGESYATDQYSEVEVTSTQLTGGQWIGPAVRSQNGGQNAYVGIYFWNSGSPVLRLYRRSAGTFIQIGSTYNCGVLPAGTQLKLTAVGPKISLLQNGVERVAASDSSFTGGAPGIVSFGAATADNWSGGNATSSSSPGFQIDYVGSDANGVASYDVTSTDNGYGTQKLRILPPSNPAAGVPHNFLYVLPVEAGMGTVYGDGLETMRALNAQNQYNLTIIEPSFAIEPWYADNPTDPNLHYETFMTDDLLPWVTQTLALTGHEQHWLIGFSKSGIGATDLILKHPGLFTLAASWDFPADMSAYDQFGSSSASSYGTDASFQANYRLTPAFVDAHRAPFLSNNRLWIGGYQAFRTDMSDFDALLSAEGIAHTTETPQLMPHTWGGGWVPVALAALRQDNLILSATP